MTGRASLELPTPSGAKVKPDRRDGLSLDEVTKTVCLFVGVAKVGVDVLLEVDGNDQTPRLEA